MVDIKVTISPTASKQAWEFKIFHRRYFHKIPLPIWDLVRREYPGTFNTIRIYMKPVFEKDHKVVWC